MGKKVGLVLLVLSQFSRGKPNVLATPSAKMGGVLSTRDVHTSLEFQSLYWGSVSQMWLTVCMADPISDPS